MRKLGHVTLGADRAETLAPGSLRRGGS